MKWRRTRGFLLGTIIVFALEASASTVDAQKHEAPRVDWQPYWRKFQLFEYVTTSALWVSSLAIQLSAKSQQSGPYGGLLFDDAVRKVLRARTRHGRNTAKAVADWGYRSMLVLPYVDLAVAWALHRNSEVAWQMLLLNVEAQSVAGFLGLFTNHFIARARPSSEPCNVDASYEAFCFRGSYSSFVSGHTVMAAAGAGVMCAHHSSMPLYGGGAGDIAACAVGSAAAVTVGVSRIVNDRHWATDVVTAWLIGAATGYVWPKLFHYRSRASEEPRYAILPSVTPDALAASVIVWK